MKLLLKILLPVTVLIALLVGLSGYVAYTNSSASLENAVVENMQDETNALKRITGVVLGNSMQHILSAAMDNTVLRFFGGDVSDKERQLELSGHLATIVKAYSDIDRINVFDKEGAIISSSNPAVIGQNFKTRPYFMEAMRGSNFVSAPFQSNITKQGVIIVSTPVRLNGAIVGVVNATVPLPEYYEQVIKPVGIGERGYAYAMDAQGRIVVHRNAEWLFREDLPDANVYKKMASSPDGALSFKNAAGLDCFAYFVKEPFSNMTLVIQAEKDDVFASLADLRLTTFIVIAAAIALGSLLLLLIIIPIVKALNKGVVFASEIARGNLNGTLDVRRNDEIGTLADALRSIPESLKQIITEYQRVGTELVAGNITVQGDASKFSGDFANLVEGTNAMLSRYQLMMNSLTSPVVVLDKNQRITYLNKAAQQIGGQDYKGKTCGEVMARKDFRTQNDALQKAATTLQPAQAETEAFPQGKRFDISYTAIPFLDNDGKLATVLQLITDLTQIKDTQRMIMSVAAQAGDISNRVAAASEELSAQVSQVNSGTEIQRERVGSTATAMEEMTATVLEVARSAASASEQAGAASKKTSQGSDLVNQVIQAINEVNTVAAQVDANMRNLGQQTEAIGSVLNVISDIADQTNLLALNAAIEAARAGEAGRGFAVVADEVRKLAESTMNATSEVGTNIKSIQAATAANIERVSQAAEGTAKATEIATVSGQALNEILSLINTNAALITSIATAAEQQSATSEEINHSIEDINRIAEETAHGMEESSTAVSDLAKMAQELKTLLEQLQKQ